MKTTGVVPYIRFLISPVFEVVTFELCDLQVNHVDVGAEFTQSSELAAAVFAFFGLKNAVVLDTHVPLSGEFGTE